MEKLKGRPYLTLKIDLKVFEKKKGGKKLNKNKRDFTLEHMSQSDNEGKQKKQIKKEGKKMLRFFDTKAILHILNFRSEEKLLSALFW